MQLDQNASQNTVERTLAELSGYLLRTKQATEPGGPYNAFQSLDDEDKRIAGNLQEFVRTTGSFHSSRSTVIGRGTVIMEGSLMGTPLTQEEKQRISDQIPTIDKGDDGKNDQTFLMG